MKSLFYMKFNWAAYFIMVVLVRFIFLDISWISWVAVSISLFQFILLFNAVGHYLPVRYLFGALMCVQFLLGPTFAYNGLDKYQYIFYVMRIPEEEYFGYVIPALIAFLAGLHISAGKLESEKVDEARITMFVNLHPKMPYTFIILGLSSSLLASFFGAEIAFIFYLLGGFKFIGLFMLILGSQKVKVLPMIVVIGSIISSSLTSGMFHDLLTWLVFLAAVFAIKYKFSFKVKLIGAGVFLVAIATIQVMKGTYRSAIGMQKDEAGLETFVKLTEKKDKESGGLLSFENLASSNVRINQGFIITNIMRTVPEKVPFANGDQMLQLLEAGIMPRILAPDKLKAGDRAIFTKYSGIGLTAGTSMGLSSVGDAYINFGKAGGAVFMFFYGLMISTIINIFYKQSRYYPVLILFVALVFYYPIRPDCELQTIFGHIFKSCFLIFVMIHIWQPVFRMRTFIKTRIHDKMDMHPVN